MQSHVDELAGAIDTLISHVNVDSTGVFVLTNSEGALHALNYQLQATSWRFKGLVTHRGTRSPSRSSGAQPVVGSSRASPQRGRPNETL